MVLNICLIKCMNGSIISDEKTDELCLVFDTDFIRFENQYEQKEYQDRHYSYEYHHLYFTNIA